MKEFFMTNKPKITRIKLNAWTLLALAVIVFFFWEPLLIIGGSLAVGWLIYRNRKKFLSFWNEIAGKN